MKDLVYWICDDCTKKAKVKCLKPFVTIHQSVCEACCREKFVAPLRDYGYPDIRQGQYKEKESFNE